MNCILNKMDMDMDMDMESDSVLFTKILDVLTENLKLIKAKKEINRIEKGLDNIKNELDQLEHNSSDDNAIYIGDLSENKRKEIAEIYGVSVEELVKEFNDPIGYLTY